MGRDIPSVRILPMSDKAPGFVGLSIGDVQRRVFLGDMLRNGGRFRYPRAGLVASAGTVVLFQYRARVIASARLVRDERFERPVRGYAGVLHFEVGSIRTFEPVGAEMMRKVWPAFRAFGHVKQALHPGRYGIFARRLKEVEAAASA